MDISQEFVDYLQDLFSVVPNSNVKKMFGGVGVFRHGIMYAVSLKSGKLALKVDEQSIPVFEEANCEPWVYENAKSGKKVSMGYWYAPEFILDDPEALEEWGMRAFESAMRIDQAKPASQQKLKM